MKTTYVCSLCEGIGEVACDFSLGSTGLPRIESCPACVLQGLKPTIVVAPSWHSADPMELTGDKPKDRE